MDVEENLEDLINETVPVTTKRNTEWGYNVFKNYCARNEVTVDFHSVTEEELSNILKRFYANIRRKNGELYSPSGLVCIRAALHRTLTSPPFERNMNILQSEKFIAANRIFDAKCKVYLTRGNAKPKHKQQINEGDMKRLGEYFKDFRLTPRKLVEFVWFGLCYYFGRRGREGFRELKSNSFEIK